MLHFILGRKDKEKMAIKAIVKDEEIDTIVLTKNKEGEFAIHSTGKSTIDVTRQLNTLYKNVLKDQGKNDAYIKKFLGL